jgi:hypothetical protein
MDRAVDGVSDVAGGLGDGVAGVAAGLGDAVPDPAGVVAGGLGLGGDAARDEQGGGDGRGVTDLHGGSPWSIASLGGFGRQSSRSASGL